MYPILDKPKFVTMADEVHKYSFIEHRKYLDALLEEIGVTKNLMFVIHDWGSALGFD